MAGPVDQTRSGRTVVRVATFAVCAALIWGGAVGCYLWRTGREQRAQDLAERARALQGEAGELIAARAEGQAVEVQTMSRAEAASWAYWETVARKSNVPTESFTIEPSFEEPEPGSGEPALLTTKVQIESLSLRQLLAFLFHITNERPYVAISSVEAEKTGRSAWDATIAAFLYFREKPPRPAQ